MVKTMNEIRSTKVAAIKPQKVSEVKSTWLFTQQIHPSFTPGPHEVKKNPNYANISIQSSYRYAIRTAVKQILYDPSLVGICVLIYLMYIATQPIRIALWFVPSDWLPPETTSALSALCYNHTCTAKFYGTESGLATAHVYGALTRKPESLAKVYRSVLVDDVDMGACKDVEFWFWYLKHKIKGTRLNGAATFNNGVTMCLTASCTNKMSLRTSVTSANPYDIVQSVNGSFASIGSLSLQDVTCQHLVTAPGDIVEYPVVVAIAASGGYANSSDVYTQLANNLGVTMITTKITYSDMLVHFKCKDRAYYQSKIAYSGLQPGFVLPPKDYKSWKMYLKDLRYVTVKCLPLDILNQYRFATFEVYNAGTNGLSYCTVKPSYGGDIYNYYSGSLLPGYESIVDSSKLALYISDCFNLMEYFLQRDLPINVAAVKASAISNLSQSKSFSYAMKAAILSLKAPRGYTMPQYPGGMELIVEDPSESVGPGLYQQTSVMTVYGKNSIIGNITTAYSIAAVPNSAVGVLSYLELDIMTAIFSFPGLETLAQKLLNQTLTPVQPTLCSYYAGYMHNRRSEVNLNETYLVLCNELFAAYNEWKVIQGYAPKQPVRDSLPPISPFIYFNSDPIFNSTDVEVVSALFTAMDHGNLILITQGLLNIRIGFRGFLNETKGTITSEELPRLFMVKSKFNIQSFCTETETTVFKSDTAERVCKIIAFLTGLLISIRFVPAIYVYLAYFNTMNVGCDRLSLFGIQDIVMTIGVSDTHMQLSIAVFSLCSAFVSLICPAISFDIWYVNSGAGLDLSWISWLSTASSSGMWLFRISILTQQLSGKVNQYELGWTVPSFVNLIMPVARFVTDSTGLSDVEAYDGD